MATKFSLLFLLSLAFCQISHATTNLNCDAGTYTALFCDYLLPKTAKGGNASKPWVIGGNHVVNLTAGNYEIGTINKFGSQISAIFIIENGSLIIENQLKEVAFGADIYLCDNAQFRIKDSKFRLNSVYQFQYMIWSSGHSKTHFQGLNFTTISAAAEAANPNLGSSLGAQYIVDNASLTAVAGKNGYSVTSYRFGIDSWELLNLGSANVNIDRMFVMSEFYIASQANFTVTNSRDFDFFFEACPGSKFEVEYLPELCSLNASDTSYPPCLTPSVAPIDFKMGYPKSQFTINFKNVSMYSWAVSIFQGANVTIKNVGKHANLNFGLNMAPICADENCNNITKDSYTVRLGPNIFEGFDELFTLSRINTTTQGFQIWFQSDNLNLTILNGSTFGDVTPSAGSTVKIYDSHQIFGSIYLQPLSNTYFYDCIVDGSVSSYAGSNVYAERTTFNSVINLLGNLYLADSTYNKDLLGQQDGSQLFSVSLSSPLNNSVYATNDSLIVSGNVTATQNSNSQSIIPFPTAYLTAISDGYQVPLGNVNSSTTDGLLGIYDLVEAPPGTWIIQLDFGPGTAASSRTIQIVGSGTTTTTTTTTTTGRVTTTADATTTGESSANKTMCSFFLVFLIFYVLLL